MRNNILFSNALVGLLGVTALAGAQVVSAPANFKSGANGQRSSYSYDPAPAQLQQAGYKITGITTGLAADRAGFKITDVIIQVNGKPFRSENEFNSLIRAFSGTTRITYFEGNTGIVKAREVRHLFSRLGLSGEIVPLSAPIAPFAPSLPPGPIGLPPGAIIAPVNPGTGFPG